MKCIYCEAIINETITHCQKCGKATQIVPDYSIYDDDNIHVLLEGTEHIQVLPGQNMISRKKRELQKKRTEALKKKQSDKFLKLIAVACIVFFIAIMAFKMHIDNYNETSFDYQLEKGTMAFSERDYETALIYFEQANRLSPENCEVLFSLSQIYFKLNEETDALNCLQKVIQLDNSHKKAYNSLLDYYENKNETESILELIKTTDNAKILELFQDYIVDMPSVNLSEGRYQDYIKLALSSKMNTKIYYTLDGSNPIETGKLYRGQIPINEMGTFTLKAVCKNEKGVYSEILTQTYDIEIAPPKCPVVSTKSGTYTTETYISVSVPSGCSAYYIWEDATPTENDMLYVSPILIPEGRNQVLSIILIDNNTGLASSVYRGLYDYIPETTTEEEPEKESEESIVENEEVF